MGNVSRGILIRGLPGSGKSTLAVRLAKTLKLLTEGKSELFIVEHDIVRELKAGSYVFEKSDYNRVREDSELIIRYLTSTGKPVIVSNVFTTKESLSRFSSLFDEYIVITCTGEYGSIHNVKLEDMKSMRNRWETIEGPFTYTYDKEFDHVFTAVCKLLEIV